MTTPEERFMKLFEGHYVLTGATMRVSAIAAFRDWSTEYATTPRADMPVLDENGATSNQWYKETANMPIAQQERRYAAASLARAEWLEAKEQREADAAKAAETQLSERRNAVLAGYKNRCDMESAIGKYEDFVRTTRFDRIAVDMIIEAEDAK